MIVMELKSSEEILERFSGMKMIVLFGNSGCAQLGIDATKSTNGLDGIHIMDIDWNEIRPKMVECAELYLHPRRG